MIEHHFNLISKQEYKSLTLQERLMNAKTDENTMVVLQDYLHQEQTREALLTVLDILKTKGIKNKLQETWQLLTTFTSPVPREDFLTIWVNISAYDSNVTEQNIAEIIQQLEKLTRSRITEEWAYLCIAQYYFANEKAPKARHILRKCLEHATTKRTTKLFYC